MWEIHRYKTKKKMKENNSVKSPYDVLVNVLNCNIVVSEFELQSCYYVDFWTNTHGKGMIPLIHPAMS